MTEAEARLRAALATILDVSRHAADDIRVLIAKDAPQEVIVRTLTSALHDVRRTAANALDNTPEPAP